MERMTYNAKEVAEALGVCKSNVYEAIKTKEIRAVKIGKRLVIPKAELERLLNPASE